MDAKFQANVLINKKVTSTFKSICLQIFAMFRFTFSLALLLFSFVVTFYAILTQKTGFWNVVPGKRDVWGKAGG